MIEVLPVKELALMAAGAILTLLGAILSDARKDRYRRRAKFEEACLDWLNSQGAVLGSLRRAAEVAQVAPVSAEEHEKLLAAFEPLGPQLSKLNESLNAAAIYSQSILKSWFIERHSSLHEDLNAILIAIVRHHRIHIEMHADVACWEEQLNSMSTPAGDYETDQKLDAIRNQMTEMSNKEKARLSGCTKSLIDDAKNVQKTISRIDRLLPGFRMIMGSSWL